MKRKATTRDVADDVVHGLAMQALWQIILSLLKQYGLPLLADSLGKLKEKIQASKMPRLLKAVLIAAIDALMKDPALFAAYART